MSVDRQCIHDFLLDVIDQAENADAVLSIACGAGIQSLAERLPGKAVLPGLNTMFIGESSGTGLWQERCQGCGDCMLGTTGGLCPVTRCAKGLLNGPCGGSQGGMCEVSMTLKCDVPCVWAMIYDRLSELGELDRLTAYCGPKDWRPAGGQRPPAVGAQGSLRSRRKPGQVDHERPVATGLFLWVGMPWPVARS